jgi:hypothetical protein
LSGWGKTSALDGSSLTIGARSADPSAVSMGQL